MSRKRATTQKDPQYPVVTYEITVHCLECNYKMAKGGLTEPSSYTSTEIWVLSMHNPKCKIPQQCECLASISKGVSTTEVSHTTHYLVSAVK